MKLLKKCAPKFGAIVLTLAVAASMMCCVAFAADTAADGDTGAATNAVVTVVDSDGNVLSENEIVIDETEGEAAVEDEGSAASVETAEGEDEASDEANVEADTETEADAESDEEIVEDGNSSSSKRFYIVGGIILAVGIAFYVFLSIKTKKEII